MTLFLSGFFVQLIMSVYLARRIAALFNNPIWSKVIYGIYVAEALIYLFGVLFVKLLPLGVLASIMNLCNGFTFASWYLTMAVFVMQVCTRIAVRNKGPMVRRMRYVGAAWLALVLIGVCVAFYVGDRNFRTTEVKHLALTLNQPQQPDQTPEQLRIALLTDIHISEEVRPADVRRIVALTMAQKPDVILVGGDFMDYYSAYAYNPDVMHQMRDVLQAPMGKYYVYGNHEYRADMPRKAEWVSESGGVLLRDSAMQLAPGLTLLGRDDKTNKSRASLASLMTGLDTVGQTVMVLDHQPIKLDSLQVHHVALALSGHTHAGQIWPFTKAVTWKYGEQAYGLSEQNGHYSYTSSGCGGASPALRLGTRSEIVVIDLTWYRKSNHEQGVKDV